MMHRRSFFAASLFPGLAVPGTALRAQDAPADIRVDVNLVNVPFSVTDGRGRLLSDLSREDFEVFEDGVRQQIKFFSRGENSPLTLALLADVSGSQAEFVKDHQRDLRVFLKAVMKPGDQALMLAFGANVWELSGPTSNTDDFAGLLRDLQRGKNRDRFRRLNPPEIRGGASSVYDGVYFAAQSLAGRDGRRAIIIFSDGEDSSSLYNMMEAIEAAQEYSATIFALRYTELARGNRWTARNKYGKSVLERLAKETGGVDYDATLDEDLRAAFQSIAATLRSSYDLAYTSSAPEDDETFRKIKIRCRRPDAQVRHKSGYYARRT
jgi:Ca-activated chloride channel family protein